MPLGVFCKIAWGNFQGIGVSPTSKASTRWCVDAELEYPKGYPNSLLAEVIGMFRIEQSPVRHMGYNLPWPPQFLLSAGHFLLEIYM